MKTINTLILAGTIAVALTTTTKAGEAFLSPRAKANQITRVSGVNTDRNLVSGWYAGAAYKAFNTAPSMVASGAVPDVNLVSGNYLGAAAKDPTRDLRGVEFQIAPLVEKRNSALK